jgi:glycolate oxidase subunit GlcD
MFNPLSDRIIQTIAGALGRDALDDRPETLQEYGRDTSDLSANPEIVVRARETAQVEALLKLANEYRFPVTPRGAGSGLAGGSVPVCGGVLLSLTDMNRILAIDQHDLTADVQPGVITLGFRQEVRKQGLYYPPDPAGMELSTIGGNAATNAGGPACLKYGTTRDYVLGLEAVLPTGQRITTGTRTRKGVVGYNLTHLIVGSEGTLGVITGLTLKLIPHPPAVRGLAAAFTDLPAAMAAVHKVLTSGHLPSALEFMDHRSIKLVGDMLPFKVPGERPSLLIIETDGAEEQVDRDIELIAGLCRQMGATDLIMAGTEEERERVWGVRREISLRIHDNYPVYIPEDVVVPLGSIAAFVEGLPAFEDEYGFEVYAFGHAGDGNLHLNIVTTDRNNTDRFDEGITAILKKVVASRGTISGEHGIGLAKKPYMALELSADSLELQRSIKKVFDPNNVLNPNKLFPEA